MSRTRAASAASGSSRLKKPGPPSFRNAMIVTSLFQFIMGRFAILSLMETLRLFRKSGPFFFFCFYTFITCWMVLNRKEFSVDEGERENPGDPTARLLVKATARSLAVSSGPGPTGDNSLHHKVTHIFLGMGQVAI